MKHEATIIVTAQANYAISKSMALLSLSVSPRLRSRFAATIGTLAAVTSSTAPFCTAFAPTLHSIPRPSSSPSLGFHDTTCTPSYHLATHNCFRHCCYHTSLAAAAMSSTTTDVVIPGRPTWQQTMLRIKDPQASLTFYTELLGFTLIDTLDFPQYQFSLYFLTTLPAGTTYDLTPGTPAAHEYLWSMEGVALELTHNHGTENDASFSGYHAGNAEKDGFGHIAVK